jgi:hypothetical protein
MKVTDLATLYKFQKGYMGFSPQILNYTVANFECQPVCLNNRSCLWNQFLKIFHSKFEMPIYTKGVSLNKMDNFHKGRILSV